MDETRLIWLGLSMTPKPGPRRLKQLIRAFSGDVATLWHSSVAQLRDAGLDERSANEFAAFRSKVRLEEHARQLESVGARLVAADEDEYPESLARLDDSPPALFLRGALIADDSLAIAIVGTRKASAYGRDVAGHFARQLAERGVTIVSGLAHGVDAAAHRGALDAGGRTLAVLGSGINVIYPYDHRGPADDIASQGAVLTEFPLGTPPDRFNFPRRNRIISALSLGVLVVEASEKSGALITAELAAEQGKDVFAVPGNIFSDASSGVNRLIQDGAKPVMSVDDILNELEVSVQVTEARRTAETISPDDPVEAEILNAIGNDSAHVDDLARTTGLPIQALLSTLMLMELKGLVTSAGPMLFRRAPATGRR